MEMEMTHLYDFFSTFLPNLLKSAECSLFSFPCVFLSFFLSITLISSIPSSPFPWSYSGVQSVLRHICNCRVANIGQHCWRQPPHKSVTFGLVLHGCCDCHVQTRKQTLHWEELGASDTFNSICCIIGYSYWFSFHDMEIHSHRSGHLIPNNFLTLRNMHAEAVQESALCPGLNWWTGMH